jgi:hypothetical protein
MLRRIRSALGDLWWIERNIRLRIRWSRFCSSRVPVIGKVLAALIDRSMLRKYGLDVDSSSVDVRFLAIAHPVGILLGGNGLHSPGRVVLMAGAKLVPTDPKDPEYLRKHAERRVFEFGDNVVISTGAILVGPLQICDNVIVGPGSLVNKSITEPGVYLGYPARRISDHVTFDWVAHLPAPRREDVR